MITTVTEGRAKILVYPAEKISKKMVVFYNPAMKLNRDTSILLLSSLGKRNMQIALPLAGTGVRGIRFALELAPGTIRNIRMNDLSPEAVSLMKENIALNKITDMDITVDNKDASLFLLSSLGFDYIDIDPFGSPNPTLDAAVRLMSRDGILAVTATDTSALAGSSPAACIRKYWAKPLRNEFMHETAIRILSRKVQLVGAAQDKALTPIFCYARNHYYRLFFRCQKGRTKVDTLLQSHQYLWYDKRTGGRGLSPFPGRANKSGEPANGGEGIAKTGEVLSSDGSRSQPGAQEGISYAGPIWTGQLWDPELVRRMYDQCDTDNHELYTLLSAILEECSIPAVGFYDLHALAKRLGKQIPPLEQCLAPGSIARTHFLGWGVRSLRSPGDIAAHCWSRANQ